LAGPLHKVDALFQSGRPTGLNIYTLFYKACSEPKKSGISRTLATSGLQMPALSAKWHSTYTVIINYIWLPRLCTMETYGDKV
ncbi:hypothetical protein B0H13DRAFT_1662301, partial [Mycena leptocephala]